MNDISMKRHSHIKKKLAASLTRCCYCFTLSSAFIPVQDTMNKNKKSSDPLCPRTLRSTSLLSGYLKSIERKDSFTLLMESFERDQTNYDDLISNTPQLDTENDSEDTILKRRAFVYALVTASTTVSTISYAYEKTFPVNLDFVNDDSSINLESIREDRIAQQKSEVKRSKDDIINSPFSFKNKKDFIGSLAWSGALWLLLGSRSNPIVKPIANLLYDENTKKGSWLKDRNDGLFSEFPLAFAILMAIIFLVFGVLTDRFLLFSTAGDSDIVLELAGVSLIGGASLELGRIASKEKMKTREDSERDETLADEFDEFASKKLIFGQGGSIHRSEVTRLFRRYFAKYRVENVEYPLSDLEIEGLLRAWNRRNGNENSISSAGFLKNVKINEQAKL